MSQPDFDPTAPDAGRGRQVLLLDHPESERTLIQVALELEGFSVVTAASAGIRQLDVITPMAPVVLDIVVLALVPPDPEAAARVGGLRAQGPHAHIIVIGGPAGEAGVLDRIRCLRAGADDHVGRPYSMTEMIARIVAAGRRQAYRDLERSQRDEPTVVRFGDIVVDLSARSVSRPDGPVVLTRREFELLAYLVSHPGRSFSREHLLKAVWSSSAEWQSETTVTEHVRRLRSKLEAEPRRPRWIATVQGVGYRFERRDRSAQ